MIARLFALIVKELLAIVGDNRSRTIIMVPPFVQTLVFGFAATYDLSDVPYAVFNEDRGPVAREVLAGFTGAPSFRLEAVIDHESEIAELIDSRRVLMVLRIGPDFSSDVFDGGTGRLQVIIDGRNSNTAMLALGYAESIITDFDEQWQAERTGLAPPSMIITRSWFNPNLRTQWFFVPGIVGLLSLVVTTMVTSLSVAREREMGTFDQLLVTPLRPLEILIGKVIPGMLIGFFEATIVVVLAVWLFQVPFRGDLLTLYVGIGCFLLSAVGVGMAITSISVTMQQGLLGAFMFLVPAVILSGFTTPIANMPELVQWLTLLNPLRYFIVVLRGVFLEGATLPMLADQMWPMLLIGGASLAIATLLLRRRMY